MQAVKYLSFNKQRQVPLTISFYHKIKQVQKMNCGWSKPTENTECLPLGLCSLFLVLHAAKACDEHMIYWSTGILIFHAYTNAPCFLEKAIPLVGAIQGWCRTQVHWEEEPTQTGRCACFLEWDTQRQWCFRWQIDKQIFYIAKIPQRDNAKKDNSITVLYQ